MFGPVRDVSSRTLANRRPLDIHTGAVLWRKKLEWDLAMYGSYLIGDILVSEIPEGKHAVDLADWKRVWLEPQGSPLFSVGDGMHLNAFDLKTGSFVWRTPLWKALHWWHPYAGRAYVFLHGSYAIFDLAC